MHQIVKALEKRLKELKEHETLARECKDYPACLLTYGAIIQIEKFLAEIKT